MGSPKSKIAVGQLGRDIRQARLRRRMPVAELALRAGTSPSTLARLEKGDPGVGIGTLADVLVALGLVARLADLVDMRKDDLGLMLAAEHVPKRGRSRRIKSASDAENDKDVIDPDGVAF